MDIEDYVHRIGRTARGDRDGTAYSLFTDGETPGIARQLVKVLQQSNHEIPAEIEQIAHFDRGGGRSSKTPETCHERYNTMI